MKKTVSVFLILTILMVCIIGNTVAEDFSVRNGIQFGMSRDEVKDKEKENGIGNAIDIDRSELLRYADVKVAGIDDCYISYYFSLETMIEIEYSLGGDYTKADKEIHQKAIFDEMETTLKEKYCDPIHVSDGSVFPLYTDAMNTAMRHAIMNYNEWLVNYDDYSVLIDEVFWKTENDKFFYVSIGYKYISNKEIEELTPMMHSEEDKNNDL